MDTTNNALPKLINSNAVEEALFEKQLVKYSFIIKRPQTTPLKNWKSLLK